MPAHTHQVELPVPIEEVWKFVSVMDSWAPLVPGYIEHEILSEKESTWKFKTDLGVMKKKIHLKVVVTEWISPEEVNFTLTGVNEKFTGSGYFQAEQKGDKTIMTGSIEINAEGALAKMIAPLLNNSIPQLTEELIEAVGNKIIEMNGIHSTF